MPIVEQRKCPCSGTHLRNRQQRFAFLRVRPGSKVGKQCAAPTKHNRHKHRCTRLLPAGSLTFTGHAGRDTVSFQGRLTPTKKLKLGAYRLVITATNPTGQKSTAHALSFTIVRR